MTSQAIDERSDTGFREDPERFTAVYDRYFDAIYAYVAARLGPEAAEDVAAETFTVAFRQRLGFDPTRGEVRAWLFGIATNLVARHRRAEARYYRALSRTSAEPPSPGHEGRVVATVTAEGLRPRLAAALAALRPAERHVVLLVALAELSHEEISQALGIPYGTVGSRLSRARAKLRTALEGTDR
ncbi:RNA polymerase sigma-70 factor (ECF subfamily) [Actinocorallia herbida]|uniref:RNA polymerase sigma-70 factor (ECF subfamily) n=1 Tax=Actinocorallia herbida TaxID=58109 RepID=A0A3N1DBG7_9ACTN|nr:RNA polymerase sigma factor [Actinocorallia herbida]ROO90860.1 RNA polymerase sigma-70 factor (ECF subfamily) [Actinocorallia herbida]